MDYVIETWDLTKQFPGGTGCKEITLRVPRGTVFGLLGQNGAGKSTFVRTLLGLLVPTAGGGHILGQPIGTVASRRRVGYLPELFRYPDWLTGRQLLDVHAELARIPRSERNVEIDRLIELVGLAGRADEKIKGYSKGMQQRIGLAAALLGDPEVVFLDEPTSALDPIGRKEVRELISRLREQGKTVFLNSHLLSEMESVCDQVAIIHRGELVVQGEWRKLAQAKTQVEFTAQGADPGCWAELSRLVREVVPVKVDGERTTWLVTLAHEEDIPLVVEALAERGIRLYEVTLLRPSLEEIFLHWVGQKERASDVDDCQVGV